MATSTSTKNRTRHLVSAHETRAWGERLADVLQPGDIVALVGALGSGKTTLVQGIARRWGYSAGANSPSFALANEYRTARGLLLHLDMYRLSEKELAAFPLEEYFDPTAVCLIEWADRIEERLPSNTLTLHLSSMGLDERRLESAPSAEWKRRLQALF